MSRKEVRKILKKVWYFIWEDNSIWSWIVNIILAFILIKYLVYPSIGFIFGTTHPIVAVMSGSMEHDGSFDEWWNSKNARCANKVCSQAEFYFQHNITKDNFFSFKFRNGFNTADIMIVFGADEDDIEIGDIVVYQSNGPVPIIHRIIGKWEEDGEYFITTKGDHNPGVNFNEKKLNTKNIIGEAVFRIPYLGWIKIGFVRFMDILGIKIR